MLSFLFGLGSWEQPLERQLSHTAGLQCACEGLLGGADWMLQRCRCSADCSQHVVAQLAAWPGQCKSGKGTGSSVDT